MQANIKLAERHWRFLLRLFAALLALSAVRVCYAHPMGNFSINHYAGIHVEKNSIDVLYIIDQAEIPTYQDMQDSGIVPQTGDSSLPKYLTQQAATWNKGIRLEINGEVVRLVPVSKSVIFPPGAGGLPTMKIGVLYRGVIREAGEPKGSVSTVHLHYLDENFAGHAGWKEIVVTAGDGVTLDAKQPFNIDRSSQLTNYPTNLLNSPPQDLEAGFDYGVAPSTVLSASAVPGKPVAETVVRSDVKILSKQAVAPEVLAPEAVSAPAPALVLEPNKQATPRSRFTE